MIATAEDMASEFVSRGHKSAEHAPPGPGLTEYSCPSKPGKFNAFWMHLQAPLLSMESTNFPQSFAEAAERTS